MKTTFYLHSDKESNYQKGEKLGLTGEALKKFAYALCEVTIKAEVADDGTCEIISIDGMKVSREQNA